MNELIEKVEDLKETLDKNEEIVNLKKINEEIMKDKELLEEIKKYQETNDLELKNKIINNSLFQKYKHSEAECNFIILEINKKLKEINNKGKCSK
ncbi:MAG: hypothetical protein IJ097_02365 [Bacilli bacterium]|nr:hypothetical protein [Bacilli bacterium]